jgi:hypothetical protein
MAQRRQSEAPPLTPAQERELQRLLGPYVLPLHAQCPGQDIQAADAAEAP